MNTNFCKSCSAPVPNLYASLCRACWRKSVARIPQPCNVLGCDNESATAGMCNVHYLRLRRHGSTEPRRRRSTRPEMRVWFNKNGDRLKCSVSGCNVPVKSSGLCSGHYHRKIRYGDPLGTPERDFGQCAWSMCKDAANGPSGLCEKHRLKQDRIKDRMAGKLAARAAVRYAELTGRLIRPNNCQKCSLETSSLDAHHHDYSRYLDVKYLCKKCHAEEHKAMR